MKKKNFFSFCAAALLLGTGAAKAANVVNTWTSGSTTVVLTDDSLLTVSGTGAMADYMWSSNPSWYSSRAAIKTVVIDENVTSIGNNAFFDCSGLTSVIIGNSVTSIGDQAFSGCSGLTGSLTIPNSVTSIGQWAFQGCSGLTGSLIIPNSVTSIGSTAFINCSGLTAVTIPNSVTSIGEDAFRGCSSLTNINVDAANAQYSSVDGVLYNRNQDTLVLCPQKKSGALTIPNSVTSIGGRAFSNCSGLTSITIPNSVTSIGQLAFEYCSGLTSITIPNSVTSIGYQAFSGCSGLTSITIPNSVTSIGYQAFSGCSGLTSITIPNSVTSIGGQAFYGCSGLTNINVDAANAQYSSVDGVLYNRNQDTLVLCPQKKSGALTIPNSVTSIESLAFYGCRGLTSVTIGNSVTIIGNSAFNGCSGLTAVTIPNSVTSIGNNAFYGCSGLTAVTIPNSVTIIGNNAFYGCSGLTAVTIPNSVTLIGAYAFSGCSGLTAVTIPNSVTYIGYYAFAVCAQLDSISVSWTEPLSISSDVFTSVLVNVVQLIVPEGTAAAYAAADVWKNFCIGSPIIDSGTCGTNLTWELTLRTLSITGTGTMTNYASLSDVPWSSYRSGIRSVLIDEGVTGIGSYAFSSCSGLTSITIPNSVTNIELQAFVSCSGLTSVTIPDSVRSIGQLAFSGCSKLTTVNFNADSCTTVGNDVWNNAPVSTVNIGANVKHIPSNAFSGCSALTTVNFDADSCITVGTGVWNNAPVRTVNIGDNVKYIPSGAFSGCNSLTSVTNQNLVPPSITIAVFGATGDVSSDTLYVPAPAAAAYRNATGWQEFDNIWGIYTVTFDSGDGSSVPTQEAAEHIRLTPPPAPTLDGFLFEGWFREADYLHEWIFNRDTVTANTTLYAKWVVIVNTAAPVITTQPVSGNVIEGNAETLIVKATTSDGGTLSYQWYENTTESNTGGSAIAGATDTIYSTPTNLTAGAHYYYVVVTNTNNSVNGTKTATITGNVVTVTVLVNAETPAITTHPQDATYDEGATATALTVSVTSPSDGGTLSYQWYSNATNSNTGGTLISGEIAASYTPSTATVATIHYYVVVTNTNGSATGAQTAKDTSGVATVTVNALVDAETPAITTHPQGATYNEGATATALTVSVTSPSDGGTLSYQWYSNATNSNTGGTSISGETATSYTPSTATVGAIHYYVVVTNTNGSATGAQTATTTSNVATVTVNTLVNAATPTITTQPQDATYDAGATATALSVSATSADGVLSYQWYKNTTNSNTGGTSISSATAATYTPLTATAGTIHYYVVVTNTNNSATGAQTATTTSNVATVTVNALVNAATPTITTQPQDATYDEGATATALSVSATSADGVLSYQWYSNATNSTTGGTLISGETSASYTPSTATAGTTHYYVVVTNTNNSATGAQTATTTSNVATVEVTENIPDAIETVDADKLQVYPNPTNGIVHVNNANGAEIKVHNLNGELLQTTRESRVDLSGEPNGVYLLRIGGQTLKVVKK
ncbi:hypothetical protein AGMMS49982_12900 [Bacteroidia bacterium]|nr:hypothetical protein AGMMS49982_12900 [Bacteroidia bacterium]